MTQVLDETSLLYSRQFLAGPHPHAHPAWPIENFARNLYVCRHPALPATRAAVPGREILCLGHILDPENPGFSDDDILKRILSHASSFIEFEEATSALGGRWLVFIRIGDLARLYPDAAGMKNIFFLTPRRGAAPWIASQPGLLADLFGLTTNTELVDRFRSGTLAESWPGEITPFSEIRQLLPNHYLDLQSSETCRFWPREPIAPYDVDTAAASIRRTLYGILEAATRRKSVAMTLTGGYDSRALFACAGDLRSRVTFFSVTDPSTRHYDVSIPKALTRMHGLRVNVIRARRPTHQSFGRILKRNVCHMYWDPGTPKIYSFGAYPEGWFVVTGNIAEVARCFYYKGGVHPSVVTPAMLAEVSGYARNPVATEAFGQWLRDVPANTNIPVLDLFYWEHRLGNWCAMGATALDTVCDILPAYNCRRMLERALGIDVAFRRKPYALFRRLCETAAPETVGIPFNDSWLDRLNDGLRRVLPWRVTATMAAAKMKVAGLTGRSEDTAVANSFGRSRPRG